ncbi:DUF2911 domain-containing protein [Algoriphagus sediminis]|uniref:DUF2911 domain-containing protein n=1 Tax=Algoriphagus sediminis TaxID=3057113 RepID=A0ABT7YHE5_9BACT|nr:DUF2911 domain-containing protein [Algoriphagus sediminis]MDN3205926.1 DUF2911 domain-containing protein [Algoriphagus sediminis]
MLKNALYFIGILFIAIIAFFAYGMLFPVSPLSTSSISSGGIDISVEYSQPSKKDRLIFGTEEEGALQPYGQYWRLGANAVTEITFSKNVLFAGQFVEAGSYRMYAIPGADSFIIALNSETGVYLGITEPDYELDILRVDIPVEKSSEVIETLDISFEELGESINMMIKWDTVSLKIPISNP